MIHVQIWKIVLVVTKGKLSKVNIEIAPSDGERSRGPRSGHPKMINSFLSTGWAKKNGQSGGRDFFSFFLYFFIDYDVLIKFRKVPVGPF